MPLKFKKVRLKGYCSICDSNNTDIVREIDNRDQWGESKTRFCDKCWEFFMKVAGSELKRWLRQEARKRKGGK